MDGKTSRIEVRSRTEFYGIDTKSIHVHEHCSECSRRFLHATQKGVHAALRYLKSMGKLTVERIGFLSMFQTVPYYEAPRKAEVLSRKIILEVRA